MKKKKKVIKKRSIQKSTATWQLEFNVQDLEKKNKNLQLALKNARQEATRWAAEANTYHQVLDKFKLLVHVVPVTVQEVANSEIEPKGEL